MFAALLPWILVTRTLATPAAWAGVVQKRVVGLTKPTSVAATPPMVTPVMPVKKVPVMVTMAPPAVLPVLGEMAETVGMGIT